LVSLIDHTLPLTKDEDQQYLDLLKRNIISTENLLTVDDDEDIKKILEKVIARNK
jgi:Asp-tRNA(Asn)/Glu-tRNA(Gln) amidotransferase B subunit